MTTYKTALEAIRHSQQYGEIAQCEDTPQNRDQLRIESDGNCETNDGQDYWADDPESDEKMLWRVETVKTVNQTTKCNACGEMVDKQYIVDRNSEPTGGHTICARCHIECIVPGMVSDELIAQAITQTS